MRGVDLDKAWLERTNMVAADLSCAEGMFWWNSERCSDLTSAFLVNPNLRSADLSDSNLTKATLWGGDYRMADLRGVTLDGAEMNGSLGEDLDVRGADFTGASLREVKMDTVCWDETTKWPEDFIPPTASEACIS